MLLMVTYVVSRGAETNALVTSVVTVVPWHQLMDSFQWMDDG